MCPPRRRPGSWRCGSTGCRSTASRRWRPSSASTRATRSPPRSSAGSAASTTGSAASSTSTTPCSPGAPASSGSSTTRSARRSRCTTERRMVPGKTVSLTLSAPLQNEVEQVLDWVGAEYQPKVGDRDRDEPRQRPGARARQLARGQLQRHPARPRSPTPRTTAIGLSYEPGSTFKAVTVAGALQDGVVTPNTQIYVPSYLDPYGFMITDAEDHPVRDAVASPRSSRSRATSAPT